MGSLLVVSGPPGAGKSTVAESVCERSERSALVEGDVFFGFLRRGRVEPWLIGSADQNAVVTRAAATSTAAFVRGGYDVVYDGVVGPWYLDIFASGTGLADFDYAILLPPVEACVARVDRRIGHGFRDEAGTRKMHAEFAAAAVQPRHVVTVGGTVDEVVAELLARRTQGELRYASGR